jgi:hypothetical protein
MECTFMDEESDDEPVTDDASEINDTPVYTRRPPKGRKT